MTSSSAAAGLIPSVVEPASGLASTVSALTDGATKAAPIANTSEQPNRKCFPFLIIRQFFCSAFLRLKYITYSPSYVCYSVFYILLYYNLFAINIQIINSLF